MTTMVATGEDFTVGYFVSVPMMYYDDNYTKIP